MMYPGDSQLCATLDEMVISQKVVHIDVAGSKHSPKISNPHTSKPGIDSPPCFLCADCGSVSSEVEFFDDKYWDAEDGKFYCEKCWWQYSSHGQSVDLAERKSKMRKMRTDSAFNLKQLLENEEAKAPYSLPMMRPRSVILPGKKKPAEDSI